MTKVDLSKYIGIPYEDCNCFDLVKNFYSEALGCDIGNYWEKKDPPPRELASSLIVSSKGDFVCVESPSYGDIVVVNLCGYSCHLGIYIGEGRMLHTAKRIGSCIEPLSKYKRLIDGFYRHQEIS